jgi:hypothetical protein
MDMLFKWCLILFFVFLVVVVLRELTHTEALKPEIPELIEVNKSEDVSTSDMDLYGKAVNESRLELCNEISSSELKYACRSIVTGRPDHCYHLGKPKLIRECTSRYYLDSAFKKNNPRLCRKIKDEKLHDSCLLKFAVERGKSRICEGLIDEEMKKHCISRAAKQAG